MRWEELLEPLDDARPAFERANRSWASETAARLGATSLEAWMRARRMPAGDRERWRALVRGLYLGDPRRFSLLQLVDELTGEQEEGPGGTFYRIRGGNDLLPRALAAALARPVVRRAVVKRVEHGAHGVTVRALVRGRVLPFEASAAVVALPVPPLRTVEFVPALPEEQRRALRTVGFGAATKTVLHLAASNVRRGFAFGSALPVGAFWDAGEGVPGAPALVAVLAGGDLSRLQRRRGERERVTWTARHLPIARPGEVRAGRSVCWERLPFSGGGYARFDVGFAPALREALRRPFSRLTFAGEHTSRSYQGYVNGAVESGRRAAEEVAALLSRVAE
jgi:monoamine oxidase